ncbi:MAG: membrane protein insertase YidC [Alphaproteobacteria bacterium]|nr:membrane protein insertase YidC [Alphaproteobacteria bacterium]
MDQKNMIMAVAISIAILLAYQFFYELPRLREQTEIAQQQTAIQSTAEATATGDAASTTGAGEVPAVPGATDQAAPAADRATVLALGPRVAIKAPQVTGSIALTGARIDDVSLPDYRTEVKSGSPAVDLLNPSDAPSTYFAEFGWVGAAGTTTPLPTAETVWTADRATLEPSQPVTLTWDNGQGVRFVQRIAIDEHFLFTVTQRVENNGAAPITLYPYGLISRHEEPATLGFWILHEGLLGVFGGTLTEVDYDEIRDEGWRKIEPDPKQPSTGGWIGITDKYWLAALVPDQAAPFTGYFRHTAKDGGERFQVDFLREAVTIAPDTSHEASARLFAGAKVVSIVEGYRDGLGVARFDLAIDWGWFPFLTKPLFKLLDWFYRQVGNFGIAIMLLTVVVRLAFFPLANKSYQAMSKLKKLQPEMVKLRERYPDDKAKMQQELMALYKREKANPAAGCLPILLQIPVFFALYKVIFVTIEMRHAPFYGWIRDLSVPDPTTIFNLFGLIPWTPPQFLMIGLWPLAMGVTMFLQQKINPQPPDPTQAKIMMMLPIVFTFILAPFPAGLVIYWTWSNLLAIAQQWLIMKRMGVKA